MSSASRRVAAQRGARIGGQELDLGSSVLADIAEQDRRKYIATRGLWAPLPPVRERSRTAELPWQNSIIALARQLQVFTYHPKLSQWSARGWPDLSLLGDRAFWIECKTDSGQLSEHQVDVLGRMMRCGLEVYVFRPWHGLEAVAEAMQHGHVRGLHLAARLGIVPASRR